MSSFITVNGMTVYTAVGGQQDETIIGASSINAEGGTRHDQRALKRKWMFKTRALPPRSFYEVYTNIMGAPPGMFGHYFPFDNSATSVGGLAPSQAVITYRPTLAGDGFPIVDASGVAEAHNGPTSGGLLFGAAAPAHTSVQVDQPSNNYLDPLQSGGSGTGQSTAVFTATNATLSNATTGAFFASPNGVVLNAPLVTPSAANSIFETGAFGGAAAVTTTGGSWIGHAYLRALTGTATVQVGVRDVTNATSSYTTATITSSAWTKIESPALSIGGASSDIRLSIKQVGTIAYIVGGLQLERQNQVFWATGTAFRSGSSTSGTPAKQQGMLKYAVNPFGQEGITVNIWGIAPLAAAGGATAQVLFSTFDAAGSATQNALQIYGQSPLLETFVGGVSQGVLNPFTSLSAGWNLITAVWRFNPPAGYASREIWLNGTIAASDNAVGVPNLTTQAGFVLGSAAAGAKWWGGRIDDVEILPYPASATAITAASQPPAIRYGDGGAGTPQLVTLGGSFFSKAATVQARGWVASSRHVGIVDPVSKVWRSTGQEMTLVFEEY